MKHRARTGSCLRVRAAVAILCLAFTLGACNSPRVDVPRPISEAWPHPEETALGSGFAKQLAGYNGQSGIYPLVSGMEAFNMRAGLAATAERTLDLQYYSLTDNTTTAILLYSVLRAAGRGVRVRLLVDDLYALGKDFDLATFSAHANIEVRVFNPFRSRGGWGLSQLLEFFGDSTRLNRRMHNKLWVADNAAAVVGGRNLGDEYFDASGEVNFADFDIMAAGPVVRDISHSFDDFWNSDWAVPIEAFVSPAPGPEQLSKLEESLAGKLTAFRDTPYAQVLREGGLGLMLRAGQLQLFPSGAIALYDKPEKITKITESDAPRQVFASQMEAIMGATRQEVLVITPYFIPDARGIANLGGLAQRGVHVRVLTNSLASTDYVPLAFAGYAHVRTRLLQAGVELYEMRPDTLDAVRKWLPGSSSGASLHTKAIVADRRHVVLGSMNLDPRSRGLNTEVALVLDSQQLGAGLAAVFHDAVRPEHAFRVTLAGSGPDETGLVWISEENGREVRYENEPMTGFLRRWISHLLGVLAPQDLF